MATTYKLAFSFTVSSLKAIATKIFGDSARSNSNVTADVASKFAQALSSDTGNAAAGGADRALAAVYSIAASGTATIDLTTLTDLAERTAQSFARLKFVALKLLPVTQGGTACSSVTVGNAATNANTLYMGGATDTTVLENGDFVIAGKGTAAGKVVDATHKSILITNNDSVLAASVLVVLVGGST